VLFTTIAFGCMAIVMLAWLLLRKKREFEGNGTVIGTNPTTRGFEIVAVDFGNGLIRILVLPGGSACLHGHVDIFSEKNILGRRHYIIREAA